jgi:hypothetical protein
MTEGRNNRREMKVRRTEGKRKIKKARSRNAEGEGR